jgi:hypothetical protein
MTNEELDILWFKAMRQSVEEDKAFIRYHFAALVAAAEREACAKVCEADSLSWGQKYALWGKKYAAAIRARGET